MPKLVFGTSNPNKLVELRALTPESIQLVSMAELGITDDLPETQDTIPGNAIQKVDALYQQIQTNAFAEDTGLEVDALDGAPGVYTARYAGPERSAEANMDLLLRNLKDKENRGAQFRTVIAMIWAGETHTFEGIVRGKIAEEKSGDGGFGYDPIFIPEGYDQTFAQLSSAIKNKISHRGRAVQKMLAFLEERA
jgi:XTP/dITP diphosphohydrolase